MESEVIQKLVHDVLKPIRSAGDCFSLMNAGAAEVMKPEMLSTLASGLEHSAKALQDFGTITLCNDARDHSAEVLDWTSLVGDHVDRLRTRKKLVIESALEEGPLKSKGFAGLAAAALDNLTWFATHYGNKLTGITLKALQPSEGGKALSLTYRIQTPMSLNTDFGRFGPFFALSKETLSLTHNTGLLLHAVKQIAELHAGTLNFRSDQNHAALELVLPLRQ